MSMTSSYMKEKLTPYTVIRLPKEKALRQKIRQKRVLSTRFLDNFYDPDIHRDNFFKPGGLYIRKK